MYGSPARHWQFTNVNRRGVIRKLTTQWIRLEESGIPKEFFLLYSSCLASFRALAPAALDKCTFDQLSDSRLRMTRQLVTALLTQRVCGLTMVTMHC